ncbi:MAG: hypothetical protein RLZZ481_2105 [Pseudomonadota bacterium]|jgi:hypothetical protein
MNTYKIAIETDINVTALKDYKTSYQDIQAATAQDAVEKMKNKYGAGFIVTLISIM